MIRRSRNNSAIPSLPKISTEDVRSFQARGPIPPYEGYNGPSPQFNTASPQYNQFQSPQYNSFNGPYMISPRFSPNSIPQEYQPIPFNYIPPQVQRIPAPPLSERPQRGRPIRLQKSEPELGKQDSDKDQLIADMKETIQVSFVLFIRFFNKNQ